MQSAFDYFDSYGELNSIVSAAKTAEIILPISSDSAVTQCRKALELAVKWMFRVDSDLNMPFDDSLFSMMSDETFKNICEKSILMRMDVVRKLGNQATHANSVITKNQADICIENLFYILDFITYCYFDDYEHKKYPRVSQLEMISSQDKQSNQKHHIENAKTAVSTYPAEPIVLTPESVNTIYGSRVCSSEMTRSQLEILLSYLDEGDLSLTDEQKECVNFTEKSDLLIKGTAGSGKSIVLLQRAIRLRKSAIKYKSDDSVLIATYVNSLVSNFQILISSALQKDTNISISTLDHIANSLFYNRYGKFRTLDFLDDHSKTLTMGFIEQAKQQFAEKYPNRRAASMKPAFLYEEFQWIKGSDINSIEEYRKSGRAGRGSATRLSDTDYSDVFNIYCLYNNHINNEGYIERLDVFAKLVHETEQEAINIHYDYVLVDEAQDLPPVILKFAKRLARKSITIAADSAQKIYSGSFSLRNLGIEIRGRASKSLSSSFRNTKEISQFASCLYSKIKQSDANDQDQFTDPAISTRLGDYPSIMRFESYEDQAKYLCNLVRSNLKKDNSTIGVLVRSFDDGRVVAGWLRKESIDCGIIKGGKNNSGFRKQVRLCTMHSAKGLEFDIVIIPLFEKGKIPLASSFDGFDSADYESIINQERKLLYVSITRPKNSLYILYTGNPSPFIEELDTQSNYDIKDKNNNSTSCNTSKNSATQKETVAPVYSNSHEPVSVGTKVYHKKFGDGMVTGLSEKIVSIDFLKDSKSFLFPDAFLQGFLEIKK